MPSVFQDLAQAVRGLRKRPGFTLAAIVTLAVGIGANVTVFSFVDALLLRPMPFGDRSERVVTLHSTHPLQAEDWEDSGVSYQDLVDVQRETRSFDGVGGFLLRNFTVTSASDAERLLGLSVTPSLFSLLDVQPMLGRNFLPEEAAAPGLETSVILTHGLWQRRFGSDPSIIGGAVMINERARTVVGVMPPGFKFPHRAELYMPFRWDEASRADRNVFGLAVLKPDVSLEQAQSDVTAVATALATRYPNSNREFGIRVLRFRDAYVGAGARAVSVTLMAAVAFVLLVACANLANLLLVRGASRQREMAVRAAMGARRARLIWVMLSESAVLAVAGTIAGIFVAAWTLDYMRRAWPEELPYWFQAGVDDRLVGFTILLTVFTILAVGLLPALRASRLDVVTELKEGARGVSLGRSAQRLQSVLAASQVALCLALLVGANLMIRSFLSLQRADLGFDDAPMLTMRVYLSGDAFDEPRARAAFFDRVVQAMKVLPGTAAAVVTSSIPGDDGGSPTRIVVDGRTDPRDELPASVITTTAGIFDTLGLRMIDGRTFTPEESADHDARVTIINERLAQRLWPGASALGHRIGLPGGDQITWLRVIGVAPNVHYEEPGEETDQSVMNVYVPYAVNAPRTAAVMLRAAGDPRALMSPARDALRRVHGGLPIYDMRTMREVRRFTSWEQQFFGLMMGTFATTALLLACLGVYALLAYAARRRTHEIGVRLALGADGRDVVWLFLRQAGAIGLVGLIVGGTLAVVVARTLRTLLFGVDALDPWTFVLMGAALLVAVVLASYVPARRAARIDPIMALRAE